MTLTAGSRLGAYEIIASIGIGGMGEVYRARDTKLGREVALKVLPESFTNDPERVARFQREAQLLAALNHPHIGAIYGLEHVGGIQALVLELVDGESLDKRIARGPIPVEDFLILARQIAAALEAAHEKGIIHRDLKPANIALTREGTAKVLDFGLAKAAETTATVPGDPMNSPTITSPMMMTSVGVILGTAAYMSPEQVKGFPADHRSDIFSFGVVAYEMLTGRRGFQGETMADLLASVLTREPDLKTLPPDIHPRVADLLTRCLEKSPRKRWQAIGDVRLELEALEAAPRITPAAGRTRAPARLQMRWTLATAMFAFLIGAGASTAWWSRRPAPVPTVARFSVALGPGMQFPFASRQMLAISPDGAQFVFAATNTRAGGDGAQAATLYLHRMADFDSRPIAGVEGGMPAFSPDGGWLAFYTANVRGDQTATIKKLPLTGGDAVTLCDVSAPPAGISWTGSDVLFSDARSIQRVPATGGVPEQIVHLNPDEAAYGPQMLTGDTVLFTLATGTGSDRWERAQIVVESIGSHQRKILLTGGSDARYVPTGHLVYARGGILYAVPFDLRRLSVLGQPVPVIEGVRRAEIAAGSGAAAHFSFSRTGTLVYFRGPAVTSIGGDLDLVEGDRSGAFQRVNVAPGRYAQPRIAPDGKRLAVGVENGAESYIAIYDLSGASAIRRLTFGGHDRYPVWSPDSRRVAFQSDREGDRGIFWQDADGGAAERLTQAPSGESHVPDAWSPSGDILLFSVTNGPRVTLSALTRGTHQTAQVDGIESKLPINAVFSPDGRWIAYEAASLAESAWRGNVTVYVQPFPPTGLKYQISKSEEVGHHPLWAPDGKELFYIPAPGRLVGVAVAMQPSFSIGNPHDIPRTFQIANAQLDVRNHDITPDGKRFVGLTSALPTDQSGGTVNPEIRVVLNWFDELKARVPIK